MRGTELGLVVRRGLSARHHGVAARGMDRGADRRRAARAVVGSSIRGGSARGPSPARIARASSSSTGVGPLPKGLRGRPGLCCAVLFVPFGAAGLGPRPPPRLQPTRVPFSLLELAPLKHLRADAPATVERAPRYRRQRRTPPQTSGVGQLHENDRSRSSAGPPRPGAGSLHRPSRGNPWPRH
jgi:hypothetical protein